MKIINAVFTCINVLVFAAVGFTIVYTYYHPGIFESTIELYIAVFSIPVFAIVNGIWMRVRNNRIPKPLHALEYVDSNRRIKNRLERLNKVFIFLNILLYAVIIIDIIIELVRYGDVDWLGKLFMDYSLFFELINVTWIICYVYKKDRLEEQEKARK